jgi:hypothetical protein
MINFLFGLLLGFIGGVVTKFLLKPVNAPKDIIDSVLSDFKPKEKGTFITVNKVEQYLKENPGEIKLGDIIDENE